MAGISLRRRAVDPELKRQAESEMLRILSILDDAAVTGNLTRLTQGFCGDALSEVSGRFGAYQMAGIQVSPARDSLQVELDGAPTADEARLRVRYWDRTSFLTSGSLPATANDAVQLKVSLDRTREPWRISSILEE